MTPLSALLSRWPLIRQIRERPSVWIGAKACEVASAGLLCWPTTIARILLTSDDLIRKDFYIHTTVLSSTLLGLVRCRWLVFAHCP
jgi:hypothetical protein